MIKRKQIVVIGLIIVLMGLLLSLNIKGLVKDRGQNSGGTTVPASGPNSNLTIEGISETAKQSLNANLAQQISELETALKSAASANQKLELQKQLAQKWDDVNQPVPSALYYEAIAQKESTYANWLKAGDLFTIAYQGTQDTLIQPALTQKATNAYQKAMNLQPNSLDAKTGLGVALVSGTPNPMQGIQLLLSVVKEDPKNIKANLNLGLFSMKSGQYDKAINRFKTVLDQKPDPESWFYLASSYENLGMKSEAIAAYEKSKELAANPALTKFIDQKVQELSK